MTAEALKRTWDSIFKRKGGNGAYTRLFESMEPDQRNTLLSGLKPREKELPVIGSSGGPGSWLILTTERLVWTLHGQRHELAAENIRDAVADFKQRRSGESKLEMRTLQVITLTGEEYVIELEPGPPLSGTWNVLKNLGARNRHSIP
ncbi:MAG: hypothetical protein AB1586_21300 [Pseudomonadota bacterium]